MSFPAKLHPSHRALRAKRGSKAGGCRLSRQWVGAPRRYERRSPRSAPPAHVGLRPATVPGKRSQAEGRDGEGRSRWVRGCPLHRQPLPCALRARRRRRPARRGPEVGRPGLCCGARPDPTAPRTCANTLPILPSATRAHARMNIPVPLPPDPPARRPHRPVPPRTRGSPSQNWPTCCFAAEDGRSGRRGPRPHAPPRRTAGPAAKMARRVDGAAEDGRPAGGRLRTSAVVFAFSDTTTPSLTAQPILGNAFLSPVAPPRLGVSWAGAREILPSA